MKKTLTICGSMVFFDKMKSLQNQLSELEIEGWLPSEGEQQISLKTLEEAEVSKWKSHYIKAHFKKIKTSDGVLIANFVKNGIPGYIGANTLMEMAFAYALEKPIFVLYNPGPQACKEEFLGLDTTVINGDLKDISV